MNKWIYVLPTCVLASSAIAQGAQGFEHFNAPGITGAFHAPWDPLGTDKGYLFSIGFFMSDKSESSPVVMWIPKSGNHSPMEVKSPASINAVARQITKGQPPNVSRQSTIEIARRLVAHTVINKGAGGFSLDPRSENNPQWIIARLRKVGLSDNDVAMLNGLLAQTRFTIGEKEWVRSWFEIDSWGAVERITVTGVLDPPAMRSLQIEVVAEAGRLDPDVLKKELLLRKQEVVKEPEHPE
jgi:hypothetical protein